MPIRSPELQRVIPWCKVWCERCREWVLGDGGHERRIDTLCDGVHGRLHNLFRLPFTIVYPGTPEQIKAMKDYGRKGRRARLVDDAALAHQT